MTSAPAPQNSGTAVPEPPRFLTAPEAAEILRLDGPWQVVALCRSGELRATKPRQKWLILREDLDAYIAAAYNTDRATA